MKRIFFLIIILLMSFACYSQTAEGCYSLGIVKYNTRDYRGAIKDYNNAIEINPMFSEAYYARASAKGNLQDYKGANADLTKAIEINPKFISAYYNRGISYAALGQHDKAIAQTIPQTGLLPFQKIHPLAQPSAEGSDRYPVRSKDIYQGGCP